MFGEQSVDIIGEEYVWKGEGNVERSSNGSDVDFNSLTSQEFPIKIGIKITSFRFELLLTLSVQTTS